MSQANVELVRAICSPWENGDFNSFDWAHPDIEFVWADGPTPGTRTGVPAMKDSWREALSAFERFDVKVERYLALDGERVLVLMHNSGRGKASGFELGRLHTRGANLFQLRNGKVTKLVLYYDRALALQAVGLSEQEVTPTNVDLFHDALAAMNRQDLDGFTALMDDDVEAAPRIAAVDGTFRGLDGIRRWWEGLYGVFPDLTFEVSEVRDLGESTLAAIRLRGSAAGSDIPIDERVWHVAWWQDGRCTRWGLYDTEAEALTAAQA